MTLKLLSNFYLDKPAVNCLTLEASYRQLLEDSVTISLALKELGVKKRRDHRRLYAKLLSSTSYFFCL